MQRQPPHDRLGHGRLGGAQHLLRARVERLDLLRDELGLPRLLVVHAAAHDHQLVDVDLVGVGGVGRVEHEHLDLALEVVERGEHHRVALLRADPLALGDHAADGDPLAVLLARQLGQRAVDPRPQRGRTSLSGWLERNRPSVSFSHSLSCLRSSGSGRDRQVVVRDGRRRRRRSEVEDRALPAERVLLGLRARGLRLRQHLHHAGARAGQRVEARRT